MLLTFAYLLVVWIGVSLLIILIHEAGHLIAGRLVGFRWETCKVGPFHLERENARWRVSFEGDWQDGFAGVLPKDGFDTRFRWIVFSLGGSAANLLFGLILLAIILHEPLRQQEADSWLPFIAFLSLLTGLSNLFPFRFQGMSSDGLHLWNLCHNGDEYKVRQEQWKRYQAEVARHDAVTAMIKLSTEGERPRLWKSAIIEQATALSDNTHNEAIAHLYAYLYATDIGDLELTEKHLERAFALRNEAADTMDTLLTEQAYWHALHHGDAANARLWLAQVGEEYAQTPGYLRAVSAACLAEGNRAEAHKQIEELRLILAENDWAEIFLLESFLAQAPFVENHAVKKSPVSDRTSR